jgi:hypothetical protein
MTFEEFIWDIMEIKGAINDDADLEESWVLYKLNQYRALHIAAEYALNNEIDPLWLQRIHKFSWERTDAADDPAITINSLTFGKAKLPKVIKLPEDIGTYRIAGSGVIKQYSPTDFASLIMKADFGNDNNEGYGYYSKIGDTVYSWPYISEGSAIIIAEDPMSVQINDNNVLRDMVYSDEYPLDSLLAQRALIDFLQKDMALKDGSITDIINDAQDKLKILKDERQVQRSKG